MLYNVKKSWSDAICSSTYGVNISLVLTLHTVVVYSVVLSVSTYCQ